MNNDDKFLSGIKKGASHVSHGSDERFWGDRAAGILLIAKDTGRLLLVLRSQEVNEPGTWGIPGGKIDNEEENAVVAAKREAQEEVGFSGKLNLIPGHVFKSGTFSFHNFIAVVDKEFQPQLDWENDDAGWFKLDELPGNLHFGIKSLLSNSGEEIKKIINDSKNESLKEIKSIIKYLVESVINELDVDEPGGGHLGKVAFGPERSDAIKEPNTPEEEEIFKALEGHFFDNEDEDLEKFAPKLISLANSNKYPKILKPNSGFAYRILSDVSLKLGSKILNIPMQDIIGQANKPVHVPSTVKVNSPVQKIQSWTMVPKVDTFSALDGSYGAPSEGDGRLYILMKANVPESGKFFWNHNAINIINSLTDEDEVISYGPVKLSGASFYYVVDNEQKNKKSPKQSNKIIIKMLIDSITSGV